MWLNDDKVSESAISTYRETLKNACPKHIVIDGLFNPNILDNVVETLQHPDYWQTQQHTYDALYVSHEQWQQADKQQRFVQRDVWLPDILNAKTSNSTHQRHAIAQAFLSYLRSDDFMTLLSVIFNVSLTDINVADPDINTNYFRLSPEDFVAEHADDSPGREVCMLLYLNKNWPSNAGGELVFSGKQDKSLEILPLFNRCVLFDPSSEGSEHWIKALNTEYKDAYRYNVTSWYWSE